MQIVVVTVLLIITVALSIYSLSVSNFHITLQEALDAIINRINGHIPDRQTDYIAWMIDYIVINDNVPRTIAAVLVGTVLAICGAVMQTLTRNPLAEPYTIGISSAAMFGVTISIALGISIIPGLSGDLANGINAFVFAMVPALVIVLITTGKKLSPNMMVLVGIGMMYVFSSITTLIKFNANEEKLQEIYIWGLGTLSKVTWDSILPLMLTAIVVFVGFILLSRKINVLMSGDNVCQSLGVNPTKVRMLSFAVVSFGVAVVVCFTGTIGFVGLVAPHITRLFTGNNNRILIPASALCGAMMILISDIIVRMLPGGLPVGVITAMIGSPMFLYFLFKQRKNQNF